MASISREPNGRRTIQFIGADRKRRSIRLGKVSQRTAEAVKVKIERLVEAAIAGHSVDDETGRWVAKLDTAMSRKLSAVGLVQKRETTDLQQFVERYITKRRDVKPNTVKIWRQTLHHLVNYFGPGRGLRSITKADARDWRLHLVAKGMADATVRKHCGFAKHFLAEAAERNLVDLNPFAGLVSSPVGNPSRQFFVTPGVVQKVIDACPDSEWRLIVALSRYGGLRCPSEHLALRWDDIHWQQQRFTVHSPKTERHAGHESRVVPLFPELLPFLENAFDAADPGAEFVINRYRDQGGNLRTQMTRIVKKAGLKPWPRIFHNLRASRQTELEATFPTHVVCAWIGNSPLIAGKHYLQLRETDFERAAQPIGESVQNPVQSSAEVARNASQSQTNADGPETVAHEKAPCLQGAAERCDTVRPISDAERVASTGVDGNRTHPATFQPPHWV